MALMDNTWATPIYFRALELGVDLSLQAGTKYIGGHSDIMFGCVSANAGYIADAERWFIRWGCASVRTTCISRYAAYGRSVCGLRVTINRACAWRNGLNNVRKSSE